MKEQRKSIVVGVVCLIMAGCGSKSTTTSAEIGQNGKGVKAGVATNSSSATANSLVETSTGSGTHSSSGEVMKSAKLSQTPKGLKNAAYDYFGLSGKTTDLQLKNPQTGIISTGSSTAHLIKGNTDSATFLISRTGQLGSIIGNDTVELTQTGVYDIGTTMGVLETKPLELPSDLHPGKTWQYNVKLKSKNGLIAQSFTQKVIGTTTLETPAGKMNVLYVKGQGTESLNGISSQVTAKSYYAKGLGLIQFEETLIGKGGKPVSLTIKLLPK